MPSIEKLKAIQKHLKQSFIGKDEIIDLMCISLIARENLFLLGPPGTAKSALVRTLSNAIENGKNFEYLLTKFTEPNELFGPFDIRKLREGELITNVEGMMPQASLVFLDEVFNANSAILNSLLMALNEKVFRRGKETLQLPALMFVGASNQLPEEEALGALLDRFLVRTKCDYVDPDLLSQVLVAGRTLEQGTHQKNRPTITPELIVELQKACQDITLDVIQTEYIEVIHSLRNAGLKLSDRRAVKLQNLIAASAIMCGRSEVLLSDLWVLKYIWDTEEQIEILAGIIDNIIEKDRSEEQAHPQAFYNKVPAPEELMKEFQNLKERWEHEQASWEEKNSIKDKLRHLQTRVDWVNNEEQQTRLRKEVDELWKQMLKE